jgi:hypothetical protein
MRGERKIPRSLRRKCPKALEDTGVKCVDLTPPFFYLLFFIGFTVGVGPGIPIGGSGAESHTRVITYGEIWDFWTKQIGRVFN